MSEYREQRKEWLSTLEVGDAVAVRCYTGSSFLMDGKVVRQTRTLFICEVKMNSSHAEQVRFARDTGLQYGGGMALHIPDFK